MRDAFFGLLTFCGFAAVALVCGIVAWPQLAAAWPSIEEKIDRFRRLPFLAKLALLLFAGAFVVCGSTKTNQVGGVDEEEPRCAVGRVAPRPPERNLSIPFPARNGVRALPVFGCLPPTVTPVDVARGWQVVEVRTNREVSYAMPAGAVLATNWWVRGAYEDVRRFDFDGWRFPFGTNVYDSVWAFSWGRARFAIADTNKIVAVGAPMSAVPYRSRLWSAADANGARIVTWENFALDRDTNTPVNAQVELRSTGDFIVRSNDVETVCRRVDPDDWDGDGWKNEDDPNPCCWEEFDDYFEQELPEGANESAYCWIEIRARWNSYIEFAGDGPSDLDDPYLWAKAGETYRVQLLIGKSYALVSSQPVDVVGRSSPSIDVDGNGACVLDVVWPVTFSAIEGNGSGFMMRVVPSGLGGTFTWTQHCCGLTGYGNQFWWAHERNCYCGGCNASGWYSYEGYEKGCIGGYCGCPRYDDDDPYETHEDDGPYAAGASVRFSSSAVIFEDVYTNRPGSVVARRSTRATLKCAAHGGERGGTATFSIVGDNKLVRIRGGALPVMRFVPPGQKLEFEIEYEGCLPSGSEEDIVATARMTGEGVPSTPQTAELTSVRVELRAKNIAQSNPSENRHVFGVHEWVDFYRYPSSVTSVLHIETAEEDLIGAENEMFFCPWTQGVYNLRINVCGATFRTDMFVVEPEMVCRDVWCVDIGAVGLAGLLDMRLALYVEPTYVSFKNLYMEEIPDDITCPHDGYFSSGSLEKTGFLSHTTDAGAGRWGAVKSDGSWMADRACRATAYPRPWSSGWKEWRIPVGWGDYNRNVKGRMAPDPTSQRFEIDADGTARIRKYDHEIERTTDNRVWLDGELQN